jgi:ribosome-binding protein aMBF1 (putative translation factor)
LREKLEKEARTVARKDQLSSNKDSCDICGTELDDDAVIQEFPDGSVVRLCAECATAAPPEEELEDDFELEPGDPTEEWAGPDQHHSPADTPRFQPEDFTADL